MLKWLLTLIQRIAQPINAEAAVELVEIVSQTLESDKCKRRDARTLLRDEAERKVSLPLRGRAKLEALLLQVLKKIESIRASKVAIDDHQATRQILLDARDYEERELQAIQVFAKKCSCCHGDKEVDFILPFGIIWRSAKDNAGRYLPYLAQVPDLSAGQIMGGLICSRCQVDVNKGLSVAADLHPKERYVHPLVTALDVWSQARGVCLEQRAVAAWQAELAKLEAMVGIDQYNHLADLIKTTLDVAVNVSLDDSLPDNKASEACKSFLSELGVKFGS